MAVTLRDDGRLGIERRDGARVEADVDAQTTIFTALVVLRFRVAGRSDTLVLPRSALGNDAHRRLRVWLKWRASVSA